MLGRMAIIRPFSGKVPVFGRDVFLAEGCSVLGDVELAEGVSIWYGAVLRGDVGAIRIGARTNVQDNATIHMTFQKSNASIGADVIIAHNAVIHGACIGDRALIGMGAVVMDNAQIGEGAWVAAGSVVPPNTVISPNTLVMGSPAKALREIREQEKEWAGGAIERYLGLAREHKAQQEAAGVRLP